MELRLREREDVRREDGADAEPDRRTQPGVPADPVGTTLVARAGDRGVGQCDGGEGRPGASAFGQRAGVRGPRYVVRCTPSLNLLERSDHLRLRVLALTHISSSRPNRISNWTNRRGQVT